MKTDFTTAVTEATTAGFSAEDWGTTDGAAPTLNEEYDVCKTFTGATFA